MKNPDDPDWDEFHDQEIVNWKRVRAAIEHENTLTNNRFTWLLSSQAFLFAAFALIFEASTKNDVVDALRPFYKYLLAVFALTGILVALFLSLGLLAAQHQHDALVRWWNEHTNKQTRKSRHPPICGHIPRFGLNLPYPTFPIVFVFAWLICLFISLQDWIAPYANGLGVALLIFVGVVGLLALGFLLGKRYRKKSSPGDSY